MNKRDRIETVLAGLQGYEKLNERSKQRTSPAEWISYKLSCTVKKAQGYIDEALASKHAGTASPANDSAPVPSPAPPAWQSPPDFTPLEFLLRWKADQPEHEAIRGPAHSLTVQLENAARDIIRIELFHRPGYPFGIRIVGLDCSLDVEPNTDNTIIVKPRSR